MNLYQIYIYPEASSEFVAIQFHVKAASKEAAEVIAKRTIIDMRFPAYPETMFERSWLKAL